MIMNDNKGNSFRMFLIDELAWKKEQQGKDIIRLTLGKTDFPLQESIRNKIVETINDYEQSNFVFPLGLPELREGLIKHYYHRIGVGIPKERLFIDSGTSSIFRNILQMILSKDDEILLPRPYYPLYKISAQLANASIKYYEIDRNNLCININSVKKNLSIYTKAIIINSPGNPIGNIISKEELIKIINILPNDLYLIFDEIYENAKFNDEPSITEFLLTDDKFYKVNIIITNSFSKAYRMYTKRVGWCILPERLSQDMLEILHHTRLTVDPSVQYGALEALSYTDDIEILNETHKKRWEYTKTIFSKLTSISLFESKGGFYCTIDCNSFIKEKRLINCYELAIDILEKKGVALVPGQDFGWPGTLRISYTNKRFNEAIDRLFNYFNN